MGLVNRVVPSTRLLDEALALAGVLASKPPIGMDAAIDDGLAIEEAAAVARIVPTHDANEGVAAFLEKFVPNSYRMPATKET